MGRRVCEGWSLIKETFCKVKNQHMPLSNLLPWALPKPGEEQQGVPVGPGFRQVGSYSLFLICSPGKRDLL